VLFVCAGSVLIGTCCFVDLQILLSGMGWGLDDLVWVVLFF